MLMTYPIDYFQIVGDDLLVNGESIMKDAFIATMAYENGDLYTFGQHMGMIFKLAGKKHVNPVERQLF